MDTIWLVAGSRPVRLFGRAVLIAFGMMCIAFALVRLLPGDPVFILLGENATQDAIAQMRDALGLNGSLPEQFIRYVGQILHGNLGTSIVNRAPVTDLVGRTLPVTSQLVVVTVVMAVLIAFPLGTAAAIYRLGRFNYVFRVVTSIMVATPIFFSGMLALLFFALQLQLAPVAGFEPGFPANIAHLWLPALVICGTLVPVLSRVIQTSVVETLDQEFVETAIVRGLPVRVRIWRYLLRPSLGPTVGLLGFLTGQLLASAVIAELVFDIPGIGRALVQAVLGRDYPVVQGIVFIFGFIVVVVSFLSDLVAGWLDPAHGHNRVMGPARLWLRELSTEARWGLALLLVIVALGSLVPAFSPYDARVGGRGIPLEGPGLAHLFGTDDLGRDVFTRTFAAAQTDMLLALLGVAIPLVVGTLIGAVIGTTHLPLVSGLWMVLVESINAFPFIVIVLALVSVVGAGPVGVVVALTLTSWARYARLARARAQVIRAADYIQATQVLGYSRWRVLLRHILPNVYSESLAYALSDFVLVILVIAGLSYLGAGLKPPAPEWGAMMSDGRLFITTAWWIPMFPGVLLSLTAVGVALLADGIERRGNH